MRADKLCSAQAPSNIALIKYMGKTESGLPCNPSLSLTLSSLKTVVNLDPQTNKTYRDPLTWVSEPGLSQKALLRFENHARFVLSQLEEKFGVKIPPYGISIESKNSFPHGAGIASSASSFAALTLACAAWVGFRPERGSPEWNALAMLSSKGSGSSCRSFYGPLVVWEADKVFPVRWPVSFKEIYYDVVFVFQENEKSVSSSEAHARVKSSKHFSGRAERATKRLRELNALIRNFQPDSDHSLNAGQIIWDEFQDMHELFRTCHQPFDYWSGLTSTFLKELKSLDPNRMPWITMDAGPNVHCMVPESGLKEFLAWAKDQTIARNLSSQNILVDLQGEGATFL